jgi:cyclohexanecarboxylate-CoA ligase
MSAEFFDRFERESRYDAALVDEFHRHGYWSDLTYRDYLSLHAERRGDEPAVSDDHRTLTWQELHDETRRLAAGLQASGVSLGDRVAFQLGDRVEWFVARLAIPWAGGIAVPLSPRFRRAELAHVLETTAATTYVGMAAYGDYEHLDTALDLAGEFDHLETLVGLGTPLPAGVQAFEDLLDTDPGDLDPERISADLPDGLNTTSGTTGLPKLYYAVQNSRLQMGRDTVARFAITPFDDLVVFAPIQLSFGIQMAFDTLLVSGASVVVSDRTAPTDLWDVLLDAAPNFVAAVPTQWTKMANEAPADLDLSSVQGALHAGAPMPTATEAFLERHGARTASIYGASEGGMATAVRLTDPSDVRYNHAGKPALSMETRVVSDGEPCPPGEVGEVRWRGAGRGFGYFGDAERTAEVFGVGGPWEDWFHSGDAGVLDEHGNLRIVGRIDNMIIRGGQNVYPPVVEDELIRHEGVADVAVVGMPDPEYGERVCAYVVPATDEPPSLSDLTARLDAAGLAKYVWPERVEVVEELPRSSSGKIQRGRLEADIRERLEDADA